MIKTLLKEGDFRSEADVVRRGIERIFEDHKAKKA